MQGEERLCLVRNEFGIFPMLLSSLSPAGATLEFKRTVDGNHFQPEQQVTLVGVDNRFEHLLREIVGRVVWFDMSYMGVAFDAELPIADLDELRQELGA
ncbi:hypothetical protein PCS_01078 [Desulfocurvibacter africanus PCS]|uniref:PilZ domain-containing protein n=1 Tax=Desulfocurvibacter africanus PCS TaxID=1262666 RepID=M5Q239_DESAF|nr:hypothetical protein [Desulfocurvibacter africanus]EMG38116.1 hypothetical protein PCS_01078 [Desulfocurvibacter africanus PCS]